MSALVAVITGLSLSSISTAATLTVPDPYPTIQSAIDVATSGDVVLVSAGTYYEILNIRGKRLDLISVSGPQATIIDAQQRGSVIYMDGGGTVRGFTITHGLSAIGGGIAISGSVGGGLPPTTIDSNIIENNTAGLSFDSGVGGALYASDARDLTISGNLIRNNTSRYQGGGIVVAGLERCIVQNNHIISNYAYVFAGGAHVGDTDVLDNVIAYNSTNYYGAGLTIQSGIGRIQGNTIAYNHSNSPATDNPVGILAYDVSPSVTISRNLVIHNTSLHLYGIGIAAGPARVECNDSWGNDVDYRFINADTTSGRNFSLDPLICPNEPLEFHLNSDSPCVPAHSGGCGLIGAGNVACGSTPVRRDTWGSVKQRYR